VSEGKVAEAEAMLRKFSLIHGIASHTSTVEMVSRSLGSAGFDGRARALTADLAR
jgi:hypothetical protein